MLNPTARVPSELLEIDLAVFGRVEFCLLGVAPAANIWVMTHRCKVVLYNSQNEILSTAHCNLKTGNPCMSSLR